MNTTRAECAQKPTRLASAACVLPIVLGGAAFGANHIKAELFSAGPTVYWPMEYTLVPERTPAGGPIWSDTYPLAFRAFELNGPTQNFDVYRGADMDAHTDGLLVEVEYLPMYPDHLTLAEGTTALVFCEPGGILDRRGVDRHLEISGAEPPGSLVTVLGLDGSWTIHAIVFPDDDPGDFGSAETIYEINSGDAFIRLTCDVAGVIGGGLSQGSSSAATYTASYRAAGSPEQTVSVTAVDPTDRGHQVFVRFEEVSGKLGPNSRLEIDVFTNSAPSHTRNGVSNAVQFVTSPVAPGTPESMHVGVSSDGTGKFYGAIHHLAIWDSVLTDLGALNDARAVAESRDRLKVAWEAEPRFWVWDGPRASQQDPDGILPSGTRTLADWDDDFWKLKGVYPYVRQYLFAGAFNTPESIAVSIADNIQDLEADLTALTVTMDPYDEIPDKSLASGQNVALFLQNWFSGPSDYYDYDGATNYAGQVVQSTYYRSLFRNWRDATELFRTNNDGAAFVHPYFFVSDPTDARKVSAARRRELSSAFYREGMSLNAGRTRRVFEALAAELDSRHLGYPERLHFDMESNISSIGAFLKNTTSPHDDTRDGWLYSALSDARAADPRFWRSAETLIDVTASFQPDWFRHNWFEGDVIDEVIKLGTFTGAGNRHGFHHALTVPAIDAFGPKVRVSNYNYTTSGDFVAPATGGWNKAAYAPSAVKDNPIGGGKYFTPLANISNDLLDFASQQFYPPGYLLLDRDISGVERLWYMLGRTYNLQTDTDPTIDLGDINDINLAVDAAEPLVEEDFDNIFVELRKHDINAAYLAKHDGTADGVQPMVPWIKFPLMSSMINDGDHGPIFNNYSGAMGDGKYHIAWQETARIMVFAYRRGAREFMLFNGTGFSLDDNVDPEGMERAINAVHYATRSIADMTSTGALDRFDHADFGVPDGSVMFDDLRYFCDRFVEADPEADVTGPDGRPDGVVDLDDCLTFRTEYETNAATSGCGPDFDCDGDVDIGDYGVFGAALGSVAGDPNYDPRADFDNDGDVDLGDYGVFGAAFGQTPSCGCN